MGEPMSKEDFIKSQEFEFSDGMTPDDTIHYVGKVKNFPKLLREDKSEKIDYSYIPEMKLAFDRVLKRLMMGEVKYARTNWRNCKDPFTYKQSMIRHTVQYISGMEDEAHLEAAIVNGLILLDLEEIGVK